MQRFVLASLLAGLSLREEAGVQMQIEIIVGRMRLTLGVSRSSLDQKKLNKAECCKARNCVDGQFS